MKSVKCYYISLVTKGESIQPSTRQFLLICPPLKQHVGRETVSLSFFFSTHFASTTPSRTRLYTQFVDISGRLWLSLDSQGRVPLWKKKSFQGPKRDLRANIVFCQLQQRGLTRHTVGTEMGCGATAGGVL